MSVPSILVVDDEPDLVMIIQLNLELAGYDVLTATNGVEALEVLGTADVDLVVLDLMMPRMNGRQVLAHLRSDPRWHDLPVVVTTAAFDTHGDGMLAAGATGLLRKPFLAQQLLQQVSEALYSSSPTNPLPVVA